MLLKNQLQTDVDKLEPTFEEVFKALYREANNLGVVDVMVRLEVDPLVCDVQ